ncbi:MAG: hypothetical protein LBL44_08975 [Treponema sp.]|jgi:hypothetical protein|nr:hypothetical protein [Treponema sp.]
MAGMRTNGERTVSEGGAEFSRVTELGGREATLLENGMLRVMIDDQGGMIPELSAVRGRSRVNAHWLPWFRSNSGKPFGAAEEKFWKAGLLYDIAGNFPCAPSFGPGGNGGGVEIPVHGWTANRLWRFVTGGTDGESGAAFAVSEMESPEGSMPLSFKKTDAVVPGESVHYASLEITNRGKIDLEICCGWHNTLGAPFLQPGCRISGAAGRWSTPPKGGEFDETTRLVLDAEFASLAEAPLAGGGKADLSLVPGPTGYTDFACGVIPASAHLGWSSLVNPALGLAYVCFFPGKAAAAEDDIVLRFNDLWMQYGGRNFTPWAPCEGGTDLAYCLGTENAAAAFAYGLEYSRERGEVLGAPAVVIIPAGKSRTLRYGTLFAPYGEKILDGGIAAVEGGDGILACGGKGGTARFGADGEFRVLKKIERRTGSAG